MLESLSSRSADVRLAASGPVFVSCFLGWPNATNLAAVRDAQLGLKARHPRQFSLTIIPAMNGVVPASAPPMQSTGERDVSLKDSAAMGKELEDVTVAAAMVILSRGLIAVMIRTFMAGLSLVSASKFEVKVFKTLPEAEAWFRTLPNAPHVPKGLSAEVEAWLAER